ncbi:hypothetical protein NCU03451 [Neurospora crassa OR74A]|uniref:Uncharacterized protein n=1 Tax=Neurospora crassa (strain ATCC 24698 / 74-OR23-1A / CBS 708.71 / DSM 1257 / FGSC 987) TaxID=367110 RepID=Q7RXU0_NEUCR|nr:hypothetical protein NCU03451 [Neurospora crassa OR74A]EAA27501.3 hypothetical protein NCU03451 [Neurospora crassa OR74A]|eukprot:XP_956737.3 hypothetical protein NCU03451 [Neurospora crassa OR74A]
MITRESQSVFNFGRGAYDTTGVPKPPQPPKPSRSETAALDILAMFSFLNRHWDDNQQPKHGGDLEPAGPCTSSFLRLLFSTTIL